MTTTMENILQNTSKTISEMTDAERADYILRLCGVQKPVYVGWKDYICWHPDHGLVAEYVFDGLTNNKADAINVKSNEIWNTGVRFENQRHKKPFRVVSDEDEDGYVMVEVSYRGKDEIGYVDTKLAEVVCANGFVYNVPLQSDVERTHIPIWKEKKYDLAINPQLKFKQDYVYDYIEADVLLRVCTKCGRPHAVQGISYTGNLITNQTVKNAYMCFSCNHWAGFAIERKEADKTGAWWASIVTKREDNGELNHHRTKPGLSDAPRDLRGSYGSRVYIRHIPTGEVIVTNNLWHQGDINEAWHDVLSANCEFLSKEAAKDLLMGKNALTSNEKYVLDLWQKETENNVI